MNLSKDAIQELLVTAKRLDEKGLVDGLSGNISIRKDNLVYITPSGKNKAFLTEEMIAVLDMDGNQVAGAYPASSEYKLHLYAYKTRPDIGGVVHAHTPYLTAYALCGKPVRSNAYPELIVVYGSIEIAAYGRPGTNDIYREVGPLLEKENIVLLENHGVMTVGKTVHDAMNTIEVAEASAKILTLAQQVGNIKDLSPEECHDLLQMHAARGL